MKKATTILVFSVGCLLALGMVILYSAQMGQVSARYLLLQLGWCGVGFLAALITIGVGYQRLQRWWWVGLILAILLLALVLVPGHIGALHTVKVNGARRWFALGTLRVQPSEFAKIALVFALAYYCDRNQRWMKSFVRGMMVPFALIGLVLGLIFKEPDWGTTVLLAGVGVCMLFVAGTRWYYMALPAAGAVAALGYLLMHDPVRLERVMAWWDSEAFRSTSGYQQWQAILAFGVGGWDGLGLGNSRQKLGFLPEHQTDFVLPIIGEELGLVVTLTVIALYAVLVVSAVYIACHAREPFGFLLGTGLTLLIGFQAAINVGVVTGTLPNKGLPLPFISYGGSNLVVMLTCVGLLISIARHAVETKTTHLAESVLEPDSAAMALQST